METYRKINQWTSQSRDMVESFKRYYNNSFLDRQRQEAYNLFLGNYIFNRGQPMLWDLSTDYYLHHADPRAWSNKIRKSYVNWFTPQHLLSRLMSDNPQAKGSGRAKPVHYYDDYWLEYYRPLAISSFGKLLSNRLNSTIRYIPNKLAQDGKYDLSPFRVRSGHEYESPDKARSRKEVTIQDPQPDQRRDDTSLLSSGPAPTDSPALPDWVESHLHGPAASKPSILKDRPPTPKSPPSVAKATEEKVAKDKSAVTQWTLDQFVASSLNPSVADSEAYEYRRYISHPLNLPLVVSTDAPPSPDADLLRYVRSNSLAAVTGMHSTEDDIADYVEFLDVGDEPLTVTEADTPKKRYKAYRQWLKGKSLFKQQRVDP